MVPFLIGLSSVATGGKDTLYECLKQILSEYSISTERHALADELKLELNLVK